MKLVIPFLLFTICIIACGKNNNANSSGPKLVLISNDSAGDYALSYNANQVSNINFSQPNIFSENLGVSYTDSNSLEHVIIASKADSGIVTYDYTLNNFELPLKITVFLVTTSGTAFLIGPINFFYANNSDQLDSAVVIGWSNIDTLNGTTFVFTYLNQNISQIEQYYVWGNQRTLINIYSYSYNSSPNIFRYTDPLLYIYSYPFTALYAQNMVIGSFFAETFSASTFNKISINPIIGNVFGSDTTSTVNIQQNSNGKIVSESFSDEIFQKIVGKNYYYK